MPDKAPDLPKIHHIQVKLSDDEYQLLDRLAHAALSKLTPYAREVFIAAMHKERVRLGLPEHREKRRSAS